MYVTSLHLVIQHLSTHMHAGSERNIHSINTIIAQHNTIYNTRHTSSSVFIVDCTRALRCVALRCVALRCVALRLRACVIVACLVHCLLLLVLCYCYLLSCLVLYAVMLLLLSCVCTCVLIAALHYGVAHYYCYVGCCGCT